MRLSRTRSCARIPLALAGVLACAEGNLHEIPGEVLTYRHSQGLTPCAGTPEYMEGYARFLVSELALGTVDHYEYTWLDPEDHRALEVRRQTHFGGIAIGRRSWGDDPVFFHEVGHTVLNVAIGLGRRAPMFPFADEGLVEAYALANKAHGWSVRLPTGSDAHFEDVSLSSSELFLGVADNNYFLLAGFAAFLLYRYGPEKYLEFLHQLGGGLGEIGTQWAFHSVYGVDLDAEFREYMTMTREEICQRPGFPVRVYDCVAGETLEFTEGRASIAWVPQCSGESALGGLARSPSGVGVDTIYTVRVFSLDEAAEVRFRLDDPSEAVTVVVGPCGGCPFALEDRHLDAEYHSRKDLLAAGDYYVRIRSPQETESTVTLEISISEGTPAGGGG